MKIFIVLIFAMALAGCKAGENTGGDPRGGHSSPGSPGDVDPLRKCGVKIDASSLRAAALGWMRAKRGCAVAEGDVGAGGAGER